MPAGFDLVLFSQWVVPMVGVYFIGWAAGYKVAIIRRFISTVT